MVVDMPKLRVLDLSGYGNRGLKGERETRERERARARARLR